MQDQNVNVSAKRSAELTGEIIDSAYALELIRGFGERFPGEVAKVFIESATIFDVVKDLPNVSGIRFMYGMESTGDPASKVILLIPCNTTSAHRPIPNTIVQPQGYLNNRGERVSLKRTWQLLYNHAVHYAGLLPEVKFKKIVRGAFFGIDSLKVLLQEYTNAHGMHYHFGWDETITDLTLQHKPVLHPLHANGTGYDVYMDFGSLCPPTCPGPVTDPECIALQSAKYSSVAEPEQGLNVFRNFRNRYFLANPENGPLVEMCYYVSPALSEAIADTGKAKEIYAAIYDNVGAACNKLIAEGKYEEVKMLYEQTMDDLMKTYLFR